MKIKTITILVFFALIASCNLSNDSEVYWTGSRGKIIFDQMFFPDYEVLYTVNDSVYYHMMFILTSDCNDEIEKFDVSDNESKAAFYINNSDQYEHNTLLAVFDFDRKIEEETQLTPIKSRKTILRTLWLDSVKVIDFELNDSLVTYTLADSSMVDYLFY